MYVTSACLQGITIIVLQATIAYYNTKQVYKGLESDAVASYDLSDEEDSAIYVAVERLRRIKWENIAFIGFQCWFVGMSFDAVRAIIFFFSQYIDTPYHFFLTVDSIPKRSGSDCVSRDEFGLCNIRCFRSGGRTKMAEDTDRHQDQT